jgi:hypothetical protein
MTSSGVLHFDDGFNLMRKIRKQDSNRVSRQGTGKGGTNKPPAHDDLGTAQHPNSKSRLGGSKSYASGTPFRNSQRFRVAILTFDAKN